MADEQITMNVEAEVEAPAAAEQVEVAVKPKRTRRAPAKKAAAEASVEKPAAKRAAAKKPAAKKAATTTKTRRTAAKAKPAAAKTEAKVETKETAFDVSRKAVLAGLGAYGKAFDQVQSRIKSLNDELETRRSKASELYNELVARGEKIESEAKEKLADIDTKKFGIDKIADRAAIEARIEKAKGRFERLRKAAGLNRVA
jgi:septation ring formation regulator EzrA